MDYVGLRWITLDCRWITLDYVGLRSIAWDDVGNLQEPRVESARILSIATRQGVWVGLD